MTTLKRTTLLGLAIICAIACGDVDPDPGTTNPPPSTNNPPSMNNPPGNPPAERTGKTDCGDLVGAPVQCDNNQYCADMILSRCELGCTSDQNCVEAQECIKEPGQDVGSCQDKAPNVNPCANVSCNPGLSCVNGQCVQQDACANVSCNPGFTCQAGQCVQNDACANVSCNPGFTCQAGQCVQNDACANVSCNPGFTCQAGQCVQNPTSCTVTLTAQDGCPANSICIFQNEAQTITACESFPACGAGNTCAPGIDGAVCSSEFIADKDPMCLAGGCLTDTHCPANAFCVKLPADIAGYCDDGSFGTFCVDNDDCGPGLNCDVPFPGQYGTCTDF